MNKKEVEIVEHNKIIDITRALENRITYLMNVFGKLQKEAIFLLENENDSLSMEDAKDDKTRETLNKMIDVFIELKPIERLIRFKYKELNPIFNKIEQIEAERTLGKFFSFMACLPNKRRYHRKNEFVQRSLTKTEDDHTLNTYNENE